MVPSAQLPEIMRTWPGSRVSLLMTQVSQPSCGFWMYANAQISMICGYFQLVNRAVGDTLSSASICLSSHHVWSRSAFFPLCSLRVFKAAHSGRGRELKQELWWAAGSVQSLSGRHGWDLKGLESRILTVQPLQTCAFHSSRLPQNRDSTAETFNGQAWSRSSDGRMIR